MAGAGMLLCSKNVRIKCESKSQPISIAIGQKLGCVQRTSGLNVKANHNGQGYPVPACFVVFKERPD